MTAIPDMTAYDATTTGQTYVDDLAALDTALRESFGMAAGTTKTIGAGGTITPDKGAHAVDTYLSATTDDLTNLSVATVRDGAVLLLYPADISRVVTLKNEFGGSGQMFLKSQADYVMNSAQSAILLHRRGSAWYEILRTTQTSASGENQQLITANGNFIVPATTVYITMVGGGGGGGGGAAKDGGASGGNGGNGGNTVFGAHKTVSGGIGGKGATATRGGQGTSPGGSPGQHPAGVAQGYGGVPCATVLGTYGQGGAGGDGEAGGSAGGGGGGAGACSAAQVYRFEVSGLTIAAVIACTIGAGGIAGTAGGGATAGGAGTAGAILVEW